MSDNAHPRNRIRAFDEAIGDREAAAFPEPEELEGLPPAAREAAARLRERATDPDPDADPGAPEDVGIQDLFEAVAALREGLQGRGLSGATAAHLHRGLDRASGELALAIQRRTVEENRQLLQDVSHDIRSPLNSILFLADTLLNEHSGSLNAVQRRQVGVLYTAAVTLVSLVNDLIDAARLGDTTSIRVSHASFSVEAALRDVESLVRPLATHCGVRLGFQLETLGPRTGDRQLLSRVLINLVTNAVKAAEEGGKVEVRVREAEEGGLRLEVHDDGPGEDVDRLRAFIAETEGQGYPTRRSRGWTHGLGLTISSRLVRAAEGEMDVDSAAGEGTTFVVRLPFRRAS